MALIFTILCGLTVLLLSYFGYYFARGYFIDGTEAAIDTEIKYISAFPDAIDRIQADPDRLYARFQPDGTPPPEIPENISVMTEGIIAFDQQNTGRRFAAKIHTTDAGQKILVGVDITKMSENYDFMMRLSLIGIFMVCAVIIFSFTISIFVVKGTNEIASTARDIMETGDLSQRIGVRWRWDDLSNMADTLNMLFDRVEQLMNGVRHVSDNIAHDLRTPLTRMKAQIDTLQEEFPENSSVQKLSSEADRVLSVFSALLRISRLESEKKRSHFEAVDLSLILKDAAEFYEPLAEERSIKISSHLAPATVTGDRDLLFQAFANILDNAVKYAPDGGEIRIICSVEGKNTIVDVTDSGKGLPERELERIFERFYRSDKSRSTVGAGLGLSLSNAIIELHGGKIRAQNKQDGFSIITVL